LAAPWACLALALLHHHPHKPTLREKKKKAAKSICLTDTKKPMRRWITKTLILLLQRLISDHPHKPTLGEKKKAAKKSLL
jgi:hypothetical protein